MCWPGTPRPFELKAHRMISLFLAAAAATPTPGAIRTFTDWTVGCDNARACQAVGLMPVDDVEGATMVIFRGPEPDAVPEIRINIPGGTASSLLLDGKALPAHIEMIEGVVHIDYRDRLETVKAIRNGQQIEILDSARKPVGSVSLRGLTAALIFMDDQQKRKGFLSAIGRPGKIPDSDVEPPPAIPVIVRPPASKLPPRALTAADIARETLSLRCEPGARSGPDVTYARLDARTTLALLPFPCENGAYNFFSYALLIDQKGKVRPATFDLRNEMGDQDHVMVNPSWNPAARKLFTESKGRGLGDCGDMNHYVWDGVRFRLIDRIEMAECRGSIDFITTWRATVVTR